ncbi:SDR family NAD(P)-dependent oxidoreductase [Brevibacterium oceani]|uniref:SDR family NAD(P)-dependent oxidoreductase n=1 Tax=Brevibacterium oceani TaxID=358099 RepID=UPI001B342AA5|nr:SDR family NAD(P)-dependent oxidoreductase [Brevibacterium oceani]
MSENSTPLTGRNTLGEWLDHPKGGPIVRELLAGAVGQDESVLAKVRNLPLNSLVSMSQGKLGQETVDELVRAANDGVLPEDASDASSAAGARFAGQTVIITGAGSGIGRATAERVVAEGGRVIAVDVAEGGLHQLAEAAPQDAVVSVRADITNDDDISRIVDAAGGRVDGLANVAGVMDAMQPVHELGNDVWERVMNINVTGTFKLSRAVLPLMIDAGRGSVVNVASEASLRGNAAGAAYTASKHAVVGLTKNSAFFYGPQGIRTNAVAPGPTATAIGGDFASEFAQERMAPFFDLIPPVTTPQTLAASITFLLSEDSANINGQILASDGGWSVQ